MGVRIVDDFWSHVRKTDTGCWEWQRCLNNGYGQFALPDGKREYAHRYAWQISNGPIPEGFVVCHHCDNRACCNPEHLFVGTQRDNIHDMIAKGRFVGRRGIGNKITREDADAIRLAISEGASQRAAARQYGLSSTMGWRIAHGVDWA